MGCRRWVGCFLGCVGRRHAQFPQATCHKPRAAFQTPTPTLPNGEGVYSHSTTRTTRASTFGCKLQATSLFLPHPLGEVAAGRRGVVGQEVGSREWDVGCGMWKVGRLLSRTCWTTQCAVSTSHEPQATSRRLNPHPGPPQWGGRFLLEQAMGRHAVIIAYQLPCAVKRVPLTGRTRGSAPTTR